MKPQWKKNKGKGILIFLVMLFILPSPVIRAEISLNLTMQGEQGAEVIFMGEYHDQGAALLMKDSPEKLKRPPLTRFVVMKVIHVIKGDGTIKPNTLIRILCEGDPEKRFGPDICGQGNTSPASFEIGHVLIVYAGRVPDHPGFYAYQKTFPFFTSVFFTGPL